MKVVLVRHGETDWNKLWRMQGGTNTDINKNGVAQAAAKAGFLRHFGFDYVFSSPLRRAVHTAEIIMKPACPFEQDFDLNPVVCENGIDINNIIHDCRNIYIDPRLCELHFGINEGRFPKDRLPGTSYFFDAPEKYVPAEGGETLQEFIVRVKDFISSVLIPLSVREPEAVVLITGHGALNKCFSLCAKNKEIKDFWSGSHIHNLSHAIYEVKDNAMTEIQDFTD